jgi:epoxyqueuosine reductase
MEIHAAIRQKALSLGFEAVGFASAALAAEAGAGLKAFLADGKHGDMGWLEARADQRVSPQALWPEAKSVVVVGLNYGPDHNPLENLEQPDRGNISVYARNRDYHDVLKKKLRVLARWMAETCAAEVKLFVDTAPVMEKPLAQAAGLGWQGRHTNLVSREFGSWLFLGEVFTTLELEPDKAETDHCGGCSRCLDICPTRAIVAPYRIDARRCISYLTIEHKTHIPRELRPLMGNRIYGCDDCLSICPWNKFAEKSQTPELLPKGEHSLPLLAELAGLDDAGFRARFSGSPVKRIGRDRFVRNVLIALGSSGGGVDAVTGLLDDDSPLVRAAAVWALSRLDPERFEAEKHRQVSEPDEEVAREWEAL